MVAVANVLNEPTASGNLSAGSRRAEGGRVGGAVNEQVSAYVALCKRYNFRKLWIRTSLGCGRLWLLWGRVVMSFIHLGKNIDLSTSL